MRHSWGGALSGQRRLPTERATPAHGPNRVGEGLHCGRSSQKGSVCHFSCCRYDTNKPPVWARCLADVTGGRWTDTACISAHERGGRGLARCCSTPARSAFETATPVGCAVEIGGRPVSPNAPGWHLPFRGVISDPTRFHCLFRPRKPQFPIRL